LIIFHESFNTVDEVSFSAIVQIFHQGLEDERGEFVLKYLEVHGSELSSERSFIIREGSVDTRGFNACFWRLRDYRTNSFWRLGEQTIK